MELKKLSAPLSIDQIDLEACFEVRGGDLVWRQRPASHFKNAQGMNSFNRRFAGRVAGSVHKPTGYVHVDVFGRKWKAHRLMWAVVFGEWPDQIDHINGNKADNRIANLRNVTHAENMKNRPRPKVNRSGVCGVHWQVSNSRWVAYLTSDGARKHLGTFCDWFDAVCARKSAENRSGFHANHGRSA